MRARLLAMTLAAAAALAAGAPAQAQLFGDNEARKAILDLRTRVTESDAKTQEQLAELARRLDRLEAAQRGQLELANQIDALRQEIARLRGQVDTLANEVATLQKRNRDLYSDLDGRLKALEPKPVAVDGRQVVVGRDEQAAFDAAMVLVRAGDFKPAASSLQQFLTRYPQSAYVPNAQYWLGNSLFALKDYRGAIAAQQVIIDRHSDSPRAPEALLNIAASQVELGQRAAARTTLQKIVSDFPQSEAAKVAADRLKALPR